MNSMPFSHAIRRATVLLATLLLVGAAAGCGSSSGEGLDVGELTDSTITLPDVDLPDVSLPDVDLPDVELPDVGGSGDDGAGGTETPEPDNSGATQPDGSETAETPTESPEEDDGVDTGVIVALVVLALAALGVVMMMARDSKASSAAELDRKRVVRSKLVGVLEVARWTDGQVGQLLDLPDPRTAHHATATLGTYVADAESRCAHLASEVRGTPMATAIEGLGVAFAATRGSVSRLTTATQEGLATARTDTTGRRADLLAAAQAVRAFVEDGIT